MTNLNNTNLNEKNSLGILAPISAFAVGRSSSHTAIEKDDLYHSSYSMREDRPFALRYLRRSQNDKDAVEYHYDNSRQLNIDVYGEPVVLQPLEIVATTGTYETNKDERSKDPIGPRFGLRRRDQRQAVDS